MAVFTVSSESPQPALRATIERIYPGRFFHWSETVSFVRAPITAIELSRSLGIQHRDSAGTIVSGFQRAAVIEVAPSYFGWTNASLWTWLKTAFEAAD